MISKKMKGRKCYDHLGGRLGTELLNFFLSQEWIELDEGKTTVVNDKIKETKNERIKDTTF